MKAASLVSGRPAWLLIAPTSSRWGSVDVPVAVEQSVRGRHRRRQRSADSRVGPAGVVEQLRRAPQVAEHIRADVGRQGRPPAAVRTLRAQLGRAQQRGHRADGVASPQDPLGRLVEQARDLLVRLDGRLREVPGAAFGLIRKLSREGPVRGTALGAGRQFHDRRPGQRMTERQPATAAVHAHQARPLRGREIGELVRPGHRRPQRAEITRTVEHGEQEQAADRGWQVAALDANMTCRRLLRGRIAGSG